MLVWYLVGAVLGCLQVALWPVRRLERLGRPALTYAAAALLGALIYGNVLWMLAWLLS